MKHLFFITTFLISTIAFSQKATKISYEIKKNPKNIQTFGSLPGGLSDLLPKESFDIISNSRYTLYKETTKSDVAGMQVSRQTITTVVSSNVKREKAYKYNEFKSSLKDYEKNIWIGSANIFDNDFKVEFSFPNAKIPVELKDETKKILNYTVKKAVTEFGQVFWYTNELKVRSPWSLQGIEGTVLQVESENETITATSITKNATDTSVFENFSKENKSKKVLSIDKYSDLKKEEEDKKRSSTRKLLKENGMDLDKIIKDAEKRAKEKIKSKNN